MHIASIPIQKEILQQIVSQVGIMNKKHQQTLKIQLDRKYNKHINLIQYHQLREDRFVLSQKRVLEKQHISIEKTKQYIKLKQDKADHNKNHSLIEKTKRVESDLTRWEKTVDKNKQEYQKKLNQSLHMIKEWNEKLSQSTSRKSMRLYNVSKTLQQRSNQKLSKVLSYRKYAEEQRQAKLKNPEKEHQKKQSESRYTKSEVKKHSRVSTQGLHDRSRKKQQDQLQKSLVQVGQKNEKINQARYMKQFLLEKKQKALQEKEENMKRIRQHRLSEINHQVEERNDILDQKFKNDRIKARNKKSSLPSVLGNKAASILLFNGPGEEWRNKKAYPQNQVSPSQKSLANIQLTQMKSKEQSPNYNRIIVEKLRNVALLVRKGKKL